MNKRHDERREGDGETTTVYARWTAYEGLPLRKGDNHTEKTHIFMVTIVPERPLCVGMRVRVMATSPRWYCDPRSDADEYDAYDAHIIGRISRVAGWKGRKVVLEVMNECAMNKVKKIRLRVPYAPEATVRADEQAFEGPRKEAHEGDLYTNAVVKTSKKELRCRATTCALPWVTLAGEGFLEEEMAESVGDRPGIPRGRKKVQNVLVGWNGRMLV